MTEEEWNRDRAIPHTKVYTARGTYSHYSEKKQESFPVPSQPLVSAQIPYLEVADFSVEGYMGAILRWAKPLLLRGG